jgi:hypothetical protein
LFEKWRTGRSDRSIWNQMDDQLFPGRINIENRINISSKILKCELSLAFELVWQTRFTLTSSFETYFDHKVRSSARRNETLKLNRSWGQNMRDRQTNLFRRPIVERW